MYIQVDDVAHGLEKTLMRVIKILTFTKINIYYCGKNMLEIGTPHPKATSMVDFGDVEEI